MGVTLRSNEVLLRMSLRTVIALAVLSESAFVRERRIAVGTAYSRGFLFRSFLSRLLSGGHHF